MSNGETWIFGSAAAGVGVAGLLFLWKKPSRSVRLISIFTSILILVSVGLTAFGRCETAGAIYCKEPWLQPFAVVANYFFVSFIFVFPVVFWGLLFAVGFWSVIYEAYLLLRKLFSIAVD